jgi:hypothetical protein
VGGDLYKAYTVIAVPALVAGLKPLFLPILALGGIYRAIIALAPNFVISIGEPRLSVAAAEDGGKQRA